MASATAASRDWVRAALTQVVEGKDLSRAGMEAAMREVMSGEAEPEAIAGLLTALRMKGETVDEITGAATVLRELAERVPVDVPHLVDTCGTGGDRSGTFNISTAAAFVAAEAGAHVAKHGNYSVSSRSGSADVLAELGLVLDLPAAEVARAIREVGIGFLFAPRHHGAMRHALGPRRALGIRTVFNLLGPLANPALAPHQVVGVFEEAWLEPLAQVLRELGSRHALVVNAVDGMDELSTLGPTHVAELHKGVIERYEIHPESLGLSRARAEDLQAGDAAENATLLRQILAGGPGPKRDIVVLNAGAALYVSGVARDLAEGVTRAAESLDKGAVQERLERLIAFTQGVKKAQ